MSFEDDYIDRNDSALVETELKDSSKSAQKGKVANTVGIFFKTIIYLIALCIVSVIIITVLKPMGLAQATGDYAESVGFCLIPTIVAWPIACLYIKVLQKRQFITGIIPIALFGPHLITSLLVILIDNAASLKTGFIVAFIVSPLSLFVASKKVGAK